MEEEEDQPLLNNDNYSNLSIKPSKNDSYRDVFASLIACIGALSIGITLGYSSPALNDKDLLKRLQSHENQMWFGSLLAIGAIFGGLSGGLLVSKTGRKTTLLLSNFPVSLGWFLIVIGNHVAVLFVGRILTGFGTGIMSLTIPLYIAEISDDSRRGILGSCFQLCVSIGILVVYSLGMVLKWNWLAVFGMALLLLYVFSLLLIPESPVWLVNKQYFDEGEISLKWLYKSEREAKVVLNNILLVETQQESTNFSLSEFFSRPSIKPILIGVSLMIFQQISGINVVIFYSASIFSNAGFKNNVALPTIIIGVILVFSTLIACITMDKLGRRILLFISGSLEVVSLTSFGVYYYLNNNSLNWLSLTSVIVFIFAFALGWGPIPWLAGSEILSPKYKNIGITITTISNWLFTFIITRIYSSIAYKLNDYGAMWLFAGFCLLSLIFVYFFLPETKGKSLNDIQKYFS